MKEKSTLFLYIIDYGNYFFYSVVVFQSNVRYDEKQRNRDFSDIFLNGGDIAQKSRFFDMISSDPIIQAA